MIFGRSRRGMLFVLSCNMLLDALEVSIVIVALPSIAAGLHVAPAAAQWVMTGFAIGFGGLLLVSGKLAAAFGERQVYVVALLGFAVLSLLGGAAPNAALLVATRFGKGACVALTAPTGLSVISATFPAGPERTKAMAVYSLFGASGFSVGLVLSGLLTEAGWRWTILFPAPVALVLALFAGRLIPREIPSPRPTPRRAPLATGPLLRSGVGAAALNGSYWGFLFVCTFQLQRQFHWSPWCVSVALLPASALPALGTPLSRRLIGRIGPARMITVGAALAPTGYALYVLSGGPPGVLASTTLVGLAFVFGFAALHVQALSAAAPQDQRMVSVAYQTSVQLGGAVVLTVVAAQATDRAALLVAIGVGVLGLVVALVGLPQPQFHRTREENSS